MVMYLNKNGILVFVWHISVCMAYLCLYYLHLEEEI